MGDGVQGADSEGGGAGAAMPPIAKGEVVYRKTVRRGSSNSQGRTTFSQPVPLDERDKETLARGWHEPRYVVSEEEDRKRGVIHRGYYVPHEGGVLEVLVREEGRIILRDPEDGTAVGLSLRGAEMLASAMLDASAVFQKSKGEV
jgi:hypothetical protein